jgi:plasmid stabilization system protein ParE
LEFVEAATRYERLREGLGHRFVESVGRALASIAAEPERWPQMPLIPERRGARRRLLKGFPYAIIYRVTDGDCVQVVAVAHQKRRPTYWAGR